MATIGPSDFGEIRDTMYRAGYGKEELKALAGGLPTKTALLAGLQAIEDRLVAQFASFKSDFETATGKTMTNAGMQKVLAAYFAWKLKKFTGG